MSYSSETTTNTRARWTFSRYFLYMHSFLKIKNEPMRTLCKYGREICTARHRATSKSSAGKEVYYYPTTSSARIHTFFKPWLHVPLSYLLRFYNWVMWTSLTNITSNIFIRRMFNSILILSLNNQLTNTLSTYIQKPLTEMMWAIINCIKHRKLNIYKYCVG